MFSLLLVTCLLSVARGMEIDTFHKILGYARDAGLTRNMSETCETHLTAFINATISLEPWALKMIDAAGKIPTGLYTGNRVDMGLYDQCVAVKHQLDSENYIKGRYCYSGFNVPLVLFPNLDMDGAVQLAACIPDSCYPSDILGDLGYDHYCVVDESNTLDGGDIACLVFLGAVFAFMVLSTFYDIYIKRRRKKTLHPILLAFSVYTNGQKIMNVSNASGQILCLNGLKVLSMFWVVCGHRFSASNTFGAINVGTTDWQERWYSAYILMAPLAVDSFLFISGALLSYGFVKTMSKPKARFNIILYYVHRYIRITPALAAVYFIQTTIIRRTGSGAIYAGLMDDIRTKCLNVWWRMFLYIQNYQDHNDMCLLHTWYLSIDMQIFIISPLILLPLVKYPKHMAYYGFPLIIAASIICPMVIIYEYELEYLTDDYYNLYYYVTHTRLAPWLIGIAFGAYILKNTSTKENIFVRKPVYNWVAWAIFVAVNAVLFFNLNDVTFNVNRLKTMFYMALQRPVWAVLLAWLTYACINGHAGIINKFLSLPIFQILSKITYCLYLVHVSLLMIDVGSARTLFYFTDYEGIRRACADIVIATGVAVFWTLAFESPMITIERIIFATGARPKKEHPNKNGDLQIHNAENNSESLPPGNTTDTKISMVGYT